MDYLVTCDWLKKKQHEENIVVIDVRFQLKDSDAGRKAYLEGHIPGAVYLDLNKDLSSKPVKHGGSHPLPEMDVFAAKLGSIGITDDTTVVIYDENNDMFAARMWWLLYYVGHENTYLLDGGLKAWVEDGNELTTEVPALHARTFEPRIRENETVDMETVRDRGEKVVLIDSRSPDRYSGKTEPMYKKAGHIPGAINYFWKDVLRENGGWKNTDELSDHFNALDKDDEIIVSCGSGVSACPNVIALKSAGFKNVKLYPGSYSDWISYDENETETEEGKS
ncbi:MAG TPA: sulfurtransferase [Virgibacillus sp.]|nr:sulfurtransferase [Virgibacillus sp.]